LSYEYLGSGRDPCPLRKYGETPAPRCDMRYAICDTRHTIRDTRYAIEEKILQLQEKKRSLVEQLLTTEDGFFKSLTRQDVEVLFG